MKFRSLLFLMSLAFIFSCSKENEESVTSEQPNTLESISFSYKGVEYNSQYYYTIADSFVVFVDKTVGKVYEDLQANPTLCEYFNPETNIIEYYDNSEEYLKVNGKKDNNISIKALNTFGTLEWFEHTLAGRAGRVNFGNRGAEVSYVGDGLNDEITSIGYNAYNTSKSPTLIIYEHANFGGKSKTFSTSARGATDMPNVTSRWYFLIEHLRSYSYGGLLGTKTWNDRVSSMKLIIND